MTAEKLAQLGARLKEARTAKGLNQKAFAALGGVGITTQQMYEAGNTPPTVQYLFNLQGHDIDIVSLLIGDVSAVTATDGSLRLSAEAFALSRGAIGPIAHQFSHHLRARPSEELDLVPVNRIDLEYGLGGTFSNDPVESEVLHFSRSWLQSITLTAPQDLTFARGKGDSMQPTIQDGDIILIDLSLRSPKEQDALWALTIGEFAMIKRLRMRGENVTILSDNDRVPDDHAHHSEVNIVGRVIFIGRRL